MARRSRGDPPSAARAGAQTGEPAEPAEQQDEATWQRNRAEREVGMSTTTELR